MRNFLINFSFFFPANKKQTIFLRLPLSQGHLECYYSKFKLDAILNEKVYGNNDKLKEFLILLKKFKNKIM